MMKIVKIWFSDEHLYGSDENGNVYRQSLLWYQKLKSASEEEKNSYSFGFDGIHWRNLDVDVSFESFLYEDAEPSDFQRFFLIHKEINITEFAKIANINPTLLRNYVNGFKKPSKERENEILEKIHEIGRIYVETDFDSKQKQMEERKDEFLMATHKLNDYTVTTTCLSMDDM